MKRIAKIFLIMLSIISIPIFLIAPHLSSQTDISQVLQGPSLTHWFGQDLLGRDILFRILSGAPVSLGIGLAGSFLGFFFGTLYGLVASMSPKWIRHSLLRITEIVMSLPNLVLLVVMAVFFQSIFGNYLALILTLAASGWMVTARLTLNLVLKESSLLYVESAKALGATKVRISLKHIFPNIFSSLLVFWALQIPHAVLAESILSFIGLGLQSPAVSWGILFQEGWRSLMAAPHLLLGPSVILFFTIYSLNLVFDGVREKVSL